MSDLPGLGASSLTAPYADAAPGGSAGHAAIEYFLPTSPLSLGALTPAPAPNGSKTAPVEASEYRPAPLGSARTAFGLEEPAHAAYVIVHETDAPHSTLGNAQELPNLPYFGVIGALGSGNSIDLYQMTIGTTVAGIQFDLVAHHPGVSTPLQFSLYDASGRVLGTWASGVRPQSDGSPLRLDLPSQSPSSTLYLSISAPSSSSAASASTTDYQLWVTRSSAPDRPLTTNTADEAVPVRNTSSPLILAPFQPSANSPREQQAQTPAPTSTATAAGTGAGLALAAGSLPTRAAGPLGGVMGKGNTTHPAGSQLSLTVNLEASVRSSPPSNLDPRVAPGLRAEPGQEDGPQELTAIRGPGGFPLLGAAAIGNWRKTPREVAAAVVAVPARPAASDQVNPLSADRLANADLPPAATERAPSLAADAAPTQPEGWGKTRVRLSFGLSMATVLTLNVILSDPVAGFDYLASRLDSVRNRRSAFSPSRRKSGGPG